MANLVIGCDTCAMVETVPMQAFRSGERATTQLRSALRQNGDVADAVKKGMWKPQKVRFNDNVRVRHVSGKVMKSPTCKTRSGKRRSLAMFEKLPTARDSSQISRFAEFTDLRLPMRAGYLRSAFNSDESSVGIVHSETSRSGSSAFTNICVGFMRRFFGCWNIYNVCSLRLSRCHYEAQASPWRCVE